MKVRVSKYNYPEGYEHREGEMIAVVVIEGDGVDVNARINFEDATRLIVELGDALEQQ